MKSIIIELRKQETEVINQAILNKEVLAAKEAARFLKVSIDDFNDLIGPRQLSIYIRSGGQRYFKIAELEDFKYTLNLLDCKTAA